MVQVRKMARQTLMALVVFTLILGPIAPYATVSYSTVASAAGGNSLTFENDTWEYSDSTSVVAGQGPNGEDVLEVEVGHAFNSERTYDVGSRNIEFSGTYRAYGTDFGMDLGFGNESEIDKQDPENGVVVRISAASNSYELQNGTVTSSESMQMGTWYDFKWRIEDGTAYYKQWKTGTQEPAGWNLTIGVSDHEGYFYADTRVGDANRTLQIANTNTANAVRTNNVSGRIVDQNGDNVRKDNVTVELWGVSDSAWDTSDAQKLRQKSEELLQKASDPLPNDWNPNRDLMGEFQSTDQHYIVPNSRTEWDTGLTLEGVESTPRLQFSEGEQVTLSCWNPKAESTWTGAPVDNSYPGATDTCSFDIERVSPTGETLDSWTAKPNQEYVTTGGLGGYVSEKKHHVYREKLPRGIYRASIANKSSDFEVVFVVGDPEEMAQMVKEDLRDESNRLTEQAEIIAQKAQNNTVWRTTVTTDANGTWSAQVPTDIVKVQAQAHQAPPGLDPRNATFSDVRAYISATDVNQSSILLSTTPTRVDNPPNRTINVTVVHADASQFKELPRNWSKKAEEILNNRLNESLSELERRFVDRLDNLNRSDWEKRFENLRELVKSSQEIRDDYASETNINLGINKSDLTDQQLKEEIRSLREVLAEQDQVGYEQPQVDKGSESVSVEFPINGEIENAQPEVVWSNGSVTQIDDKYWSVESSLLSSGDRLVIEDYPVGSGDAAVATFRANIVTSDGKAGAPETTVSNPQYDGNVPQINAIDADKLRPATGEPVSVGLRPEPGTGYDGLTSATVIAPDGSEVSSTITNSSRVQFTPEQLGYHFIRMKYQSVDGQTFSISHRIKAVETSQSTGPTIQLVDTPYGATPVVGGGLESARYEAAPESNEYTFVAITPAGEDISRLDIRPGSKLAGSDRTVHVRVVQGRDEEEINRHVRVRIHLQNGLSSPTDAFFTDAAVYANGHPVTIDGTSYGEIADRGSENKRTVEVVSNENGAVDIDIDEPPRLTERASWWLALNLPSPPSALIGFLSPGPASLSVGGMVIGPIAGIAIQRRVWT